MTGDRLFIGPNAVEVARICEEAATRTVAAFTAAELLASGLDQLEEAVIADKVPRLITLKTQDHSIGTEIVALAERRGLTVGTIYLPNAALPAREALKASLYVPCTGTRQAFTYRPSRTPPSTPPEATLTGEEVVLSVITDPGTAVQVVEKQLLDLEENLRHWVAAVNADLSALERQIRALVRGQLARRLEVLRQQDAMAAVFTIPVRPVDPDRALEIPVRPTAALADPGDDHGNESKGYCALIVRTWWDRWVSALSCTGNVSAGIRPRCRWRRWHSGS